VVVPRLYGVVLALADDVPGAAGAHGLIAAAAGERVGAVVVVGLFAPGVGVEHVQLVAVGGRCAFALVVAVAVPHVGAGDASEAAELGAVAVECCIQLGGAVVAGRVGQGRAVPCGGGDGLALELGQVEQGFRGHRSFSSDGLDGNRVIAAQAATASGCSVSASARA
jgi:hypothetical protein